MWTILYIRNEVSLTDKLTHSSICCVLGSEGGAKGYQVPSIQSFAINSEQRAV